MRVGTRRSAVPPAAVQAQQQVTQAAVLLRRTGRQVGVRAGTQRGNTTRGAQQGALPVRVAADAARRAPRCWSCIATSAAPPQTSCDRLARARQAVRVMGAARLLAALALTDARAALAGVLAEAPDVDAAEGVQRRPAACALLGRRGVMRLRRRAYREPGADEDRARRRGGRVAAKRRRGATLGNVILVHCCAHHSSHQSCGSTMLCAMASTIIPVRGGCGHPQNYVAGLCKWGLAPGMRRW